MSAPEIGDPGSWESHRWARPQGRRAGSGSRLRLDDTERTARQLPHREKYLLLVTSFLRQLLELHIDLIDQVEQELADQAATAPLRSAEGLG